MLFKQRISGSCDRQNFIQCDRCILNLLRQVLMQTDKNDSALSQWQGILTQFKQVFEGLGAIVVTSEGFDNWQVQFMTQRGKQLLNQYFSYDASHSLPESLQHWLHNQISLLISKEKVSALCFPLHIDQGGKQLLVSLIGELRGEQYLILLEEQELPSFSISALELIGLTKREAEDFFGWPRIKVMPQSLKFSIAVKERCENIWSIFTGNWVSKPELLL